MKKLLALLIACLALTVTACGDDDDDGGGDSGGGATTTEQSDTGAAEDEGGGEDAGATQATVDMKDIKFVPESLTVPAGATVTWTNSDDVPHTVTKSDGPGEEFDSGNIDGGGEFEQTFNDAGTINYECVIHPGQTGSITVE